MRACIIHPLALNQLIATCGAILAGQLSAQTFTTLHRFNSSDGYEVFAGVVVSSNILYGTTSRGGSSDLGTVFGVNTDGTAFTNLYSFTGGSDGGEPFATLVLSNNILYGTTRGSFSSPDGSVFALNTDGSGFTILYDFTGGSDGANPYTAALALSGSALYGTTSYKAGQWCYEPKYNGWRALVHAPSGAMFNRYLQPLSITAQFGKALKQLRQLALWVDGTALEWLDCEALDRRHQLGRGTLLVFDYIITGVAHRAPPLHKRKELLAQALPRHDYRQLPLPGSLYGGRAYGPAEIDPREFYQQLRQLNARWRCRFYEGLVAKRSTDPYPLQLRSPHEEFVGWVKHRWAASQR